jgi:predicted ATPase/class 3 adenylate cyclase
VPELPEGVVTFLFTDVEGSTRMFEQAPDAMLEALRQHDEAIEGAVAAHGGIPVRPRGEGDSRFIVFAEAGDAVAGAAELQRRLAAQEWATPEPLRVRVSLHTGSADLRWGDYYGSAVNRAARLRSIAHGGQTLMSAATWELVRDQLPDGVTVQDLGEHGLKDLSRPERVFQLTPEGLQGQFPPLLSLGAVPNNLPAQLTGFVGRQEELAEVARLIGETRLLTLLAPGGTGKTRLAIQAAADISSDYPDGVYFVGLAEIGSDDDITQTVAESLGAALSGDEDPRTQLLAYLAPRCQLLVFDNLEHLDGAGAVVAEILRAAPRVKVLATSRRKLGLTGETVMSLTGLDTTWDDPDEALRASGAQLFLEAAHRTNPGFVLESGDLDALAEILRLTGGMPLGILLAAAWVDMLSIGEVATEIRRSLDFLETEMRDIPDRQRSIRAVFDYSWALLSPEEREIFSALSVFRGGFSREAAEAVAEASLRGLAGLVNKSLLTASPDTRRYEVHELLRQYAAAELERDAERNRETTKAHADFFADRMGEALTLVRTGGQARLLRAIDLDIENIRSAWRYQIAVGDAVAAGQFILGLFLFYEYRGFYLTAVAFFDGALDLLPSDGDEAIAELRALIAAAKAWSLTMVGQAQAAAQTAAESTALLARSPALPAYWLAVQCLALALAYLGDAEEMKTRLDEAITYHEQLDDRFWVASLMDWRAFAAMLAGEVDDATRLIDEAIETVADTEEYWVTFWNLWVRAMIATQQGRSEDAIDLYTEELELIRDVSYVRGTMVSLDGLGEANVAAGRLEAAESAFVEGMATAWRLGMVRDVLSMMTKLAGVWILLGRSVEAVELLGTVLAEPTSAHQPFTENVPVKETAQTTLASLGNELDGEAYEGALTAGSSRSYDGALKELLKAPIGLQQ